MGLELRRVFPFVVELLYSSAIYGIVFFSQYRLQNVVDRAVATALYVDRSAFQGEQMEGAVVNRASQAMSGLLATLPGPLSNLEAGASSCAVEAVGGVVMQRRAVNYNIKVNPIVPVMSFGLLGTFPPLPDTLEAEARAAF